MCTQSFVECHASYGNLHVVGNHAYVILHADWEVATLGGTQNWLDASKMHEPREQLLAK